MLERAERVERLTAAGREAFFASPDTQELTIRHLEVIGEAAKRVPAETRALLPAIDWRGVCGMRDVLTHAYFSVDAEVLWNAASVHLPELRRTLSEFLVSFPEPSE